MIDWVTVILLIAAGIALIVVEIIFIPGTTILGIIGLGMMIVGVSVSYSKFGPNVGTAVLIVTALVGAGMTVLGFRSGVWQRFSLKSANRGRVNEDIKHNLYVDDTGKAISALRPIGKAEFGDRTFEVRTLGDYIEAGTDIKVIRIDNNRIFVEPIN